LAFDGGGNLAISDVTVGEVSRLFEICLFFLAAELHLFVDQPQVFLLGLHIFFNYFEVLFDLFDFAL
jgi:hypothetical protein